MALIPVMFSFFAMGFVDLVGAASGFVKEDFKLSDTISNLLPSLVFFWFLIFSVPTGMLMNKIGRKKTVLLSLVVTVVGLLLPFFGYNYYTMLVSFSLLGIGNAIMQTSINPLVMTVMGTTKNLASTLTFGQFVKAIASFLAPIIMGWGAAATIPNFGMGWRILFPIYMIIGILASLLLVGTPIEEEKIEGKPSSYADCFRLLAKPIVLLSFFGIMCHVGIDVGTNTVAPKILIEKLHITMKDAAVATSVYFLFRTIGCLSGSYILSVMRHKLFFIISVALIALGLLGMVFMEDKMLLYLSFGLVGFGNSNVFSIVLTQALNAMPEKQNEVSGLMIMGLVGGFVFPSIMGLVSDGVGTQIGAVAIMAIGAIYLFSYINKIKQ